MYCSELKDYSHIKIFNQIWIAKYNVSDRKKFILKHYVFFKYSKSSYFIGSIFTVLVVDLKIYR